MPTSPSLTGTLMTSTGRGTMTGETESRIGELLPEKQFYSPHPHSCTPNHVRAFCEAACALHISLTLQDAVMSLEAFVRMQVRLGACGTLLAKEMEKVRHIRLEYWSGTSAPQLFFKGALLDLAILSSLHQVGITLVDDQGTYPLQSLQAPGSHWALLKVVKEDLSFAFSVTMVAHAGGSVCRHIACDIEQGDPVWSSEVQSIIFELLAAQPEAEDCNTVKHRCQNGSQPTISSTEPMELSSVIEYTSLSPSTCECPVILPHSEASEAFVVIDGAGKGARSRPSTSSAVAAHPERYLEEEDEDLAPLTNLLGDNSTPTGHQTPPKATDGEDESQAINRPMVVFEGKFDNGRTLYSQVLWPEMNWHAAKVELNRDVRRRMVLWCMCIGGVPVDPLACVPRARTPFDLLTASLVPLEGWPSLLTTQR
eukprot:2770907-Amphidinium_carterae.3